MAVIVQKYGGSSVSDIDKLRSVADRVAAARRSGDDVVVVVSAMGKATDNLLALARQAAQAAATAGSSDDQEPDPPRRELDMLLSTGERVSMALLSIAIQARGLEAISFTGSQSGIITNDRHFDARIIEVRPHRIEDELARGRVVIVAGYQGMSYRREITTLGRGGSDTTAVALAAALSAERCEIYSDVDGVYSADPNCVAGARHIARLDYSTMQEMAECGAKVLNAQAVEWAKRNRVVIHARRTSDDWTKAELSPRETVIGVLERFDTAPRAVVTQRRLALIRAPASSAAKLLGAAERRGLPLRDLSIDGALLACAPLLNVPDFPRIRADLIDSVSGLSIDEGYGAVSLVGTDVGGRPELIGTALQALGAPPVWVVSTPLRLSSVVPESELAAAEARWHSEFVSQ